MLSTEEAITQFNITFLNPTVECCCHGIELLELMNSLGWES